MLAFDSLTSPNIVYDGLGGSSIQDCLGLLLSEYLFGQNDALFGSIW